MAQNNSIKVNSSIFEAFNRLTQEDEKVRIIGAATLIKILEETNEEKVQKQLDYALKRLIRGNGSSTSKSRIGFHTALCGLLTSEKLEPKISLILEVVQKEFHSAEDKGKVDALVGTALACGAIIRSERSLSNATENDIEEITKCLTACLSKPSVSSLAFSFLNELVIKSTTEIVKSKIWPVVKKNVSIAKDTITLDPVYLLMIIEEHHAGVIDELFYKKFWQSPSILEEKNFDVLVNLLWNNKKSNAINHPFYVYFMRHLVSSKSLKSFWLNHVDDLLESPSKQTELVTIHAAVSILRNLEDKPKEAQKMLTPNFLKMLNANGTKSVRDEDLQEMYTEFYDLLDQRLQLLKKQDQKLQLFKIFTQSPGSLTIEKSSTKKFITNIINTLDVEGLQKVVAELKSIVTGDQEDRERQYAANIFQKIITTNKLVSSNIEWRIEQLIFLVNLGIFKSKNGVDLSQKDEDINSNASNIRNIFYHCLEYKLPKLEDEKKVLMGIVNYINDIRTKKEPNKYLQKQLEAKHFETWKKMYVEATAKPDKKEKKLKIVFQVLMLHMGLQLFNNSDVAENAINELESVMKRANQKKSSQNEPDWIEVVVDLFLTLLSQESYVLRNVIRHVFPQLCSQMTVTAFHQILSLLDLNSKDNPLMVNGNNEDEDDISEISDESGSEDESDVEDNEVLSDSEPAEEETSDTEMDADDDDEEPETINDTVRMAIQSALGDAGGDGEDMDLDEMDEAQGAKLDAALADAFKMLKQSRKPKQTKADKIADKTLLHFRMRALDLVEIYLKNNPQMEICLETLIFFYDLMPIAIKNEKQSPLLPRFDGIFIQLAQLKSFSLETVQNVTQKHLADTLTNMLDKTVKEKTNIQQLNHFARACIFLINCSQILQKLTPGEDEVLKIMMERLQEFFTHRNPTLQLNTFKQILGTHWIGNFKLAKYIGEEGLKTTVRSLRRTQSFQLLKAFFKNHHLMSQNEKQAIKYHQKVYDQLKNYASEIEEVPQPEFLELIHFVMAMRNQKDFAAKDVLISAIQKFRNQHILKANVLNTYKSFCNVMKIPFVANEKIKAPKVNGAGGTTTEISYTQNGGEKQDEKPESTSNKRKKNSSKKDKKLKNQHRLELASKGFKTGFSFADTSEVMLE